MLDVSSNSLKLKFLTTYAGLSENDLIDIMSTDDVILNSVLQYHKPPIPRLPYHVFARLTNDLGDYIIERGAHAQGRSVLYWYHRQFWETARERYLPNKEAEIRYVDGTMSLL